MDLTKTKGISLVGSVVIFLLYWIMVPIMNIITGPEYAFNPLWFFITVIFSLGSLWAILEEIHKIAEPGEVRWFRNPELLEIPPKAGKP
jgi:hypothetical protein